MAEFRADGEHDARKFRRRVFALLAAGLLVRLVFAVMSQNSEADASLRLTLAQNWLLDPHWISGPLQGSWVFGPLHTYFLAGILWLFPNAYVSPQLATAVIGVAIGAAILGIARSLYGNSAALTATAIWAFTPFVIRREVVSGSEALAGLLLAFSLYLLVRTEKLERGIFASAIGLGLLCMVRYDAWLMVALVGICVLVLPHQTMFKGFRRFVLLAAPPLLFAASWAYYSFSMTGDPFYFIHVTQANHSRLLSERIGEFGPIASLYPLAFWIVVIVVGYSPLMVVWLVRGAKQYGDWRHRMLLICGIGFCLIYLFALVIGGMAPLTRFVFLPMLALIPVCALGITRFSPTLQRWMWGGFITWLLLLTSAGLFDTNGLTRKAARLSPIVRVPSEHRALLTALPKDGSFVVYRASSEDYVAGHWAWLASREDSVCSFDALQSGTPLVVADFQLGANGPVFEDPRWTRVVPDSLRVVYAIELSNKRAVLYRRSHP